MHPACPSQRPTTVLPCPPCPALPRPAPQAAHVASPSARWRRSNWCCACCPFLGQQCFTGRSTCRQVAGSWVGGRGRHCQGRRAGPAVLTLLCCCCCFLPSCSGIPPLCCLPPTSSHRPPQPNNHHPPNNHPPTLTLPADGFFLRGPGRQHGPGAVPALGRNIPHPSSQPQVGWVGLAGAVLCPAVLPL